MTEFLIAISFFLVGFIIGTLKSIKAFGEQYRREREHWSGEAIINDDYDETIYIASVTAKDEFQARGKMLEFIYRTRAGIGEEDDVEIIHVRKEIEP